MPSIREPAGRDCLANEGGRGGVAGGVQWGSAVDQNNVYVAVSDLARSRGGEPRARRRRFSADAASAAPGIGGGIYALKLATGEVVWHTPHPGCRNVPGCSPGQSAAVTAIPGAVFSGGLDGHLRAYTTTNGQIIWDVDTVRDYSTVNGFAAHGGSINGPAPTVAGGMLYVNSGDYRGIRGNVLLAFGVGE